MQRPFHERRAAFRRFVQANPRQGEVDMEAMYAARDQPNAGFAYWAYGMPIPEAQLPGPDAVPTFAQTGTLDGCEVAFVGPGMAPPRSGRAMNPAQPFDPMKQSGTTWNPGNVSPPIRSQPVNLTSASETTVSDTAFVTLLQASVPDRMNLVIDYFGFTAESGAAEEDLTWRVLRNRAPIPGLHALVGPFGSVRAPLQVNWRFTERELFQVQAISNTPALDHFVRAIAKGWQFMPSYYSQDSITPWNGR
jgi:hypothetical protein